MKENDKLNQVLAFNKTFEDDLNHPNPFDFLKKLLSTPHIILENIDRVYSKGVIYPTIYSREEMLKRKMGFTAAARLKFIQDNIWDLRFYTLQNYFKI